MRLCRPVLAAALLASASPCLAESFAPIAVKNPLGQQTAFIDLLALMSGHCKTLKVAGRTFACKTVAYAHGGSGRVNFAVAVDDPSDGNHVVSFSGENGKRADDNSYELPIDRMLLNSKDRPQGRRAAGAGRADLHRSLPADRKFRRQEGDRRDLLGHRQRRPSLRTAVRLRRHAGERAAYQAVGAVDPGSVQVAASCPDENRSAYPGHQSFVYDRGHASERPMTRDRLFLLRPGFEDPAFPGRRFYCWHCALIEGVLVSFRQLAEKLDVERIAWPRPRQPVIALVGEENQSLPLLVLADGATSPHQTGSHQGRAFIADKDAILAALSDRHGFPDPHP
ncbi:hypothetical protein ACVW0I_007983 [Bradyrhizobium sp. LM6.11]